MVFFSYQMIDLFKKKNETAYKKELVLNEVNSLNDRKDLITEKILRLETSIGEEEILREKYQVVKPGEKMINIVEEEIEEEQFIEEKKGNIFIDWIKKLYKK